MQRKSSKTHRNVRWKKITLNNGVTILERDLRAAALNDMPYRSIGYANMSLIDYSRKKIRKIKSTIDFLRKVNKIKP